MKKNTDLLEPNKFYHVFNRGINGEDLFKEYRNYPYFLQKLANYILPVAEVYAYCLMKNHFHVCIHTMSAEIILKNCDKGIAESSFDFQEKDKNGVAGSDSFLLSKRHLSNQFASLFKSYAQGINKTYNRHGQLFEEVFRRIEVDDKAYLNWLIFYIHSNPCLHHFTTDFTAYPYSSYQSILSNGHTQLSRNAVLELFGGKFQFEQFHRGQLPDDIARRIILE